MSHITWDKDGNRIVTLSEEEEEMKALIAENDRLKAIQLGQAQIIRTLRAEHIVKLTRISDALLKVIKDYL